MGDATSVVEYPGKSASPSSRLDFRLEQRCWRVQSRTPDAVRFSYGKIKAYFLLPRLPSVEWVRYIRSPAYSSVISRVKARLRYGLTAPGQSALVLETALPGCSERIPRRWVCPIGNGCSGRRSPYP